VKALHREMAKVGVLVRQRTRVVDTCTHDEWCATNMKPRLGELNAS
jgi:hypothetical protein